MTLRYISLFSGIEAATVAWSDLDFKPVAFAEIDPFCCALLAHYYPHVPNLGDVRNVDWRKYHGKADVVVGGSPCQSFSIAGNREGTNGESGLMYEYIRAVREIRPRWLVWENVPGALSVERGKAFGQLIRSLEECRYCVAWRILDARFFGLAQRRERLFVVGSLRDESSVEVLFESESMQGDFASGRDKWKDLAAHRIRDLAETVYCLGGDGGKPSIDEEQAGTLTVSGGQSWIVQRRTD